MTLTNNYVVPTESLVIGGVYRLFSRNLAVGAWDGEAFIGVREKFDQRFLDREYLWTDTSGTATPKEFYFKLDDSIKLEKDNAQLFATLDRIGKMDTE